MKNNSEQCGVATLLRKMRFSRVVWRGFAALLGLVAVLDSRAQSIYYVSDFSSLQSAVSSANMATALDATATSTINIVADLSGSSQIFVNANVTINGGDCTINMQNMDRAFFVAGGTIAMSNLTIMNGNATGGNGVQGGGGGMGAGGALFVMLGANVTIVPEASGTIQAFSGNSVGMGQAASGGTAGSAIGADIFLGADVTFNVAGTLSLSSLGGAANTNGDPNVAAHANDPNAQGGIIKEGPGTLVLTGTSYYTGATVVKSGTLSLSADRWSRGRRGSWWGEVLGMPRCCWGAAQLLT